MQVAHPIMVLKQATAAQLRHMVGLVPDEFDQADAAYLVAHQAQQVHGWIRLRPLSAEAWDMSRLHSVDFDPAWPPGAHRKPAPVACALLQGAVAHGKAMGAKRVVATASVTLERVFVQAGLAAHRVGLPEVRDGQAWFSCWINL